VSQSGICTNIVSACPNVNEIHGLIGGGFLLVRRLSDVLSAGIKPPRFFSLLCVSAALRDTARVDNSCAEVL
jgi:hypothetical protein